MKNPYEEWGSHPEKVRVSKAWAWIFSMIFIAIIALPPTFRNLHNTICPRNDSQDEKWAPIVEFFHHPNPKSIEALKSMKKANPAIVREQPNLQDHLRSFEGELEDAAYATDIRQWVQFRLTAWLGEGNAKTVIGDEGRLYYQAAIGGLVGYGPLKAEPDSVMKNPDRAVWTPPLPVIKKFAAQLKDRGIELMLVPVPVKPMIYPEGIGRGKAGKGKWAGPVGHQDQNALYEQLRQSGIDVIDLSDTFWSMKKDGEVYLKQDTHWTQATMQRAVKEVAARVREKAWFDETHKTHGTLTTREEVIKRQSIGDLTDMLGLKKPADLFDQETQQIAVIKDTSTGKPPVSDPGSPIVLLGDSFVNIFDDSGSGFGDPKWKPKNETDKEPGIGAGFAQHLAADLQTPLQIHTANGGGATQIRQEFAESGDNVVRAKKLVIWVLASRDLLLSETPGSLAKIMWRDVKFNQAITKTGPPPVIDPEATGVIIEAQLIERTPLQDPKSTPYKEAVYSALFRVDEEVSGKLNIEGKELPAYLWGFRERKVLSSGRLEAGKKYRLTLVPWASKTNLQSVMKMNDFFITSDYWFVEKVEAIK